MSKSDDRKPRRVIPVAEWKPGALKADNAQVLAENDDGEQTDIDEMRRMYRSHRESLLEALEFLSTALDPRRCIKGVSDDMDQLGLANITGFGIGFKIRQGVSTGNYAVVVLVRIKTALANVAEQAQVPPFVQVGPFKVPTDVEQVGEMSFCTAVPCGSQIGTNEEPLEAGTLGCVVKKTGDSKLYALSNNHVLSNFGKNPIGRKFYSPPGAANSLVCTLSSFVPISTAATNTVDAALGLIPGTGYVDPSFRGIGHMNPNPTSFGVGSLVTISGGSKKLVTNVRSGVVKLTSAIIYPKVGKGTAKFVALYQIQSNDGKGVFNVSGDSGAVVLSKGTLRPGALIMANDGVYGYACWMSQVISKLGIASFVP